MSLRLSLVLSFAAMAACVQAQVDEQQKKEDRTAEATVLVEPQPPTRAQELARKLREMREDKASRAQVAHIDLPNMLVERPPDFAIFADSKAPTHYSVLERIRQAAEDEGISAVLITVHGDGLQLAQAQELRDVLAAAGKPTFVYADRYTMASYTLATGAQHVCMLEGGELLMPGIAVETMFARALLDKVGISPELIQIGEYKGAAESFTRTGPSDELRGELTSLVDSLYTQMVRDIAQARKLPEAEVRQLIDRAWLPARDAKSAGLVDHVMRIDDLRALIAEQVDRKVEIVSDYGIEKDDELDLSNPFALLQLLTRKDDVPEEPSLALIYVDGMIVEGESGDDLLGGSVAADGAIRRAMRVAQRDPLIKAIVVRIDSPGGSALASEAAWQSIRRVAKEKPVVISIGGMAASGGYYIACAGDRIFVDPAAIVGSIGVVGGKMALGGLYEKLGISTETFSRGANADIFSSAKPFSEQQKSMISNLMRQTYDQFVDRILQVRKDRIDDIDLVARGRIFTGEAAVKLGLADETGGLVKAMEYAAGKGGLEEGYGVRILPQPKTLGDLLAGTDSTGQVSLRSPSPRVAPVELALLPAPLRNLALQQLAVLHQLQHQRVLLVPPVMMQLR